jgi:EAL domain-containing protein (putative c-di-GMP-specific phosphodiesterase class I)
MAACRYALAMIELPPGGWPAPRRAPNEPGTTDRVGHSRKPIESESQRRSLAICATVKAALRQDRLLFAFQPVVCAATREIDYFECLLRMRDVEGSIVAGGEFITPIEQLGLIGFIDDFVLEQTVQELANHPGVRLGLNISSLTACDGWWLQSLIALVRGRPDLARRLVVEITETAALSDIDETARFVDTLRRAGCRVALDDFGAGHTSLRHLQILAVDTVKIDGSFVRNLADSPERRILLHDLISLVSGFGFTTVAEGVENAEDEAVVRAEGFGYLQGYHLGPPTIERTWLEIAPINVTTMHRVSSGGSGANGAGC